MSFDPTVALGAQYSIERELRGGMSRVFVVRDARLGRQIVVKVLPPELTAELSVDRFRREIQVAAQLRHPHIVPLLDAGETDGMLYYTMPFITGESLRDRLRRNGTLPTTVAARLAAEVADALSCAHLSGVVHRDIKPENILIDSDHAVVTDFGIARAMTHAGASTLTRTGMAVGTLAYMSPEQVSAGDAVDARSDIYSLGCVLHEMLYGALPFALATRGTRLAPSRELRRRYRVPRKLREALAKSLAPHVNDRYATAAEFRDALLTDSTYLTRRSSAIIAAFAVAALALVAIVTRARSHSVGNSFVSPGAERRQVTFIGNASSPTISPDGAFLAYVGADTLFVQELSTGASTRLATGLSQGSHIAWSSDGSEVLFSRAMRGVFAAPRLGGNEQRMLARGEDVGNVFTASPKGTKALSYVPIMPFRPEIVTVAPGDQPIRNTMRIRIPIVSAEGLAKSPDDRWFALAASAESGVGVVALLSADGAQQVVIDKPRFAIGSVSWSVNSDSIFYVASPGNAKPELVGMRIDRSSGRPLGVPQPLLPGTPLSSFTLSADGRRLVYVSETARSQVETAKLGGSGNLSWQQVTHGTASPRSPALSPNGDLVAFIQNTGGGSDVFMQRIGGHEARRLTHFESRALHTLKWSPDGGHLAVVSAQDSEPTVLVLDTLGQYVRLQAQKLDRFGYAPYGTLSWNDAGSGIAYLAGTTRDRHIRFLDARGKGDSILFESGSAYRFPIWAPRGGSVVFRSATENAVQLKNLRTGVTTSLTTRDETGGVPILWTRDGWIYTSSLIGPTDTNSIWRMRETGGAAALYARIPPQCSWFSLDRLAHSVACEMRRNESDVILVTRAIK